MMVDGGSRRYCLSTDEIWIFILVALTIYDIIVTHDSKVSSLKRWMTLLRVIEALITWTQVIEAMALFVSHV